MGIHAKRRPLATDGVPNSVDLLGSSDTDNSHSLAPNQVDEREAFLLRAAAGHDLVEIGEPIDEVFDGLIEQFLHIVFPPPALTQWAEAQWDAPGWAEAAREYHRNRKLGGAQ